ncbi:MAG TPA: hypothetical protein VKN99_14415 [Polyangia bacterium]|nr:hypothetical protein [Polyangia bacterium]
MRKTVELRGASRRDFIRWGIYVGGLLGVRPWRIFEVLEDTGGKALAAQAACLSTNRSVHIVAGNGGQAWFNLLWPHVDVAQSGNDRFAFHAFGEGGLLAGTDKPLYLGPQAPWRSYGISKAVTAFMAGTNEAHTQRPISSSTIGTGVGLFAACAALQSSAPTLVPVIGISNLPYGNAPGAPSVATVPSADGMVGLFDSAASRMGGVLSAGGDAALFEAYYKAYLSLSAVATRPTMTKSYNTAKTASNLLGRNLSSQLQPSSDDLARYGVSLSSQTKLLELAKALITTAKAFKLGLCNCVLIPALQDDPHPAFADPPGLVDTVTTIGKSLDGFMADLMAVDDPTCAGRKIGDNVIISIHGDTPKDPLIRAAWPDGTPNDTNWIWVLGNGYLKTGWFGGVGVDGSTRTFDPDTGAESPGGSAGTAMAASAAVAYAVCKGDIRRVNDFYRGSTLKGITVPQQM